MPLKYSLTSTLQVANTVGVELAFLQYLFLHNNAKYQLAYKAAAVRPCTRSVETSATSTRKTTADFLNEESFFGN